MMLRSLYAKLSVALLGLLAVVGGLLVIVSVSSTELYRQEADQKLNRTLAALIVSERDLMRDQGVNDAAVKNIFSMLMEVNPSIEVYLLDPQGRILSYSAEAGKVKRRNVNLTPVRTFLDGGARYPILGDDPRSESGRKIFTAARIPRNGALEGYLYIILGGESYDSVLQKLKGSYILRLTLWVSAVSILVAAIAGLLLFAYLTRRLRRLAAAMSAYAEGTTFAALGLPEERRGWDEIGRLTAAFRLMAGRIEEQVVSLRNADALRRELVAGVSHDLRTPLATLQGYVETMLIRDSVLTAEERRQYLETAIRHCVHLSRLVAGLFELAKLEARETAVVREVFSISELAQDVVQKFGLAGRERGVLLRTNARRDIPFVYADISLIGRVLDNLVENAVRHTPKGGAVDVEVAAGPEAVTVTVRDTGPGIGADELPRIFDRFYRGVARKADKDDHAGLGLAIVKKILELHDSSIEVRSAPGKGAAFTFSLPMNRIEA